MAVANKKLKWGVFSSPSCKVNFERYAIENETDLKAYAKAFPEIKMFGVFNSMLDSIRNGKIVVATDKHHLSGFPTWCIMSKDSTHPSSINLVKLG